MKVELEDKNKRAAAPLTRKLQGDVGLKPGDSKVKFQFTMHLFEKKQKSK
ncbi:MAG: hypothetical protein QNL04_15255 [SAR324 cluster bacterium]|nr:hypothetical protein [SAR324 cluster bacterium]